MLVVFFFFKQKTAYEMRISDWSSDVCSSDLQCTDERGLYLEVHPNGSKLWRYKYRYMGKQKRLALGRYPDVGLAEARKRRDDARRQLETGTDPLAERKHEKLIAVFKAANTFGRSEEHTSELQSLMRLSYAVFCLKKKKINN